MDHQTNVDEQLSDALATLQEQTHGETFCRVAREIELRPGGDLSISWIATVGDISGSDARWPWMYQKEESLSEAVALLILQIEARGGELDREFAKLNAAASRLGLALVQKGAV